MILNDQATDAERQCLLLYVTRLACADTPDVEKKRAGYINKNLRCSANQVVAIGGTMFPAGRAVIVTVWALPSFEQGLAILEGALAIRRQADTFPAYNVEAHLEAVRAKAARREPIPSGPILSKMKNWFAAEETA